MQDKNMKQAIRKLAGGSSKHHSVWNLDTGFQVFGNIRHTDDNFFDLRQLIEDEKGVVLGKHNDFKYLLILT
jgi:hypothetical protein